MRTIGFLGRIQKAKWVLLSASILIISLLTFYSYLPSFDNEFLYWDDQFYVTANQDFTNPSLESLKSISSKIVSLNFHPLTMVSFWINAKASGVSTARPYIVTNVVIHILNAALVFILAFHLSNSKWLVAFITSLIFALHPMHVESVVWVSERKDVLYVLFFLTSILSYFKYASQLRKGWWMLSLVLFLFSCLSKATAVSLVPCLFLIDFVIKRNLLSLKLYAEKAPFFFIALFIGLVAVDVQSGGDFYGLLKQTDSKYAHNPNLDFSSRVSNACFSHFYYVINFICPREYSAFHPYSLMTRYNPFLVILISSVTVFTLAWAFITRNRDFVFGLGFYCFTIFLLLQFIPVGSAIVAERYTYLAYIGLAYLVGIILHQFVDLKAKVLPFICIGLITIFYTRNTRLQASNWQSHTTLFEQASENYPEDPVIRKTLASGYWAEGKVDSALTHITYAIDDLGLVTSPAFELLANCYSDSGDYEKASFFFDQAVELDPNNISARYHRGLNLLSLDVEKAIEDFTYCESTDNAYFLPLLYGPRGRAYGLLGQYDKALRDLTRAIELLPNEASVVLDSAVTYEKRGDKEKAVDDYEQVLVLDPQNDYANKRLEMLDNLE